MSFHFPILFCFFFIRRGILITILICNYLNRKFLEIMDGKQMRSNLIGFEPPGLSMIDYARTNEIDAFYIACQKHRDYYKDISGRLVKDPYFVLHPRLFSKPTPILPLYNQPDKYMVERRPVVFPNTTGRKGRPQNDGTKINLKGRYDANSCIKYMR